MFALSAVAVEREMVGKDSDGELICVDGEMCPAAAAARRAAVAVWASVFDLGEEKYCTKRVPLRVLAREERVTLSPGGAETVVVVVVLAKGLENLRGIVSMSLSTLSEMQL